MPTPTYSPTWFDDELKKMPWQFSQLVNEIKAAGENGSIESPENQEKLALAKSLNTRLTDLRKKIRDVEQVREACSGPSGVDLSFENEFAQLESAKQAAITLPFRHYFDDIIDDQAALLLSTQGDSVSPHRWQEISNLLVTELGGRFSEIDRIANDTEAQFAVALEAGDKQRQAWILRDFLKLPLHAARLQSKIGELTQDGEEIPAFVYLTKTIAYQDATNVLFEAYEAQIEQFLGSVKSLPANDCLEKAVLAAYELGEVRRALKDNQANTRSLANERVCNVEESGRNIGNHLAANTDRAQRLDEVVARSLIAVAEAFEDTGVSTRLEPVLQTAAFLFHIPGISAETKARLKAGMKTGIDREMKREDHGFDYSLNQYRINLGMGDMREEQREAYIRDYPEKAKAAGLLPRPEWGSAGATGPSQ